MTTFSLMTMRFCSFVTIALLPAAALAQRSESDFVAKNFKFVSGESLPEMKIHYVTLGRPQVADAPKPRTQALNRCSSLPLLR